MPCARIERCGIGRLPGRCGRNRHRCGKKPVEHALISMLKLQPWIKQGNGMPLEGHRILLVEDESLIAFDLKGITRGAHGEALHAATLAQAMTLADTPGLSLALLDFRLGSKTSLPISAKLCALGVPFIFYTACGRSEVLEAWPEALVVSKPTVPAELIRSLLSAAKRRGFRCGLRGAWWQGEACAMHMAAHSCPGGYC